MMTTKVFNATLDHLHEMLQWIRYKAVRTGFGRSDSNRIELAAEEAIVNIIRHAYLNRGGKISIGVETDSSAMHIEITDSGPAFNPLDQKPKKSRASLEEKEEGGLGIVFILKCMDQVSYERKKQQNVLRLVKKLSS